MFCTIPGHLLMAVSRAMDPFSEVHISLAGSRCVMMAGMFANRLESDQMGDNCCRTCSAVADRRMSSLYPCLLPVVYYANEGPSRWPEIWMNIPEIRDSYRQALFVARHARILPCTPLANARLGNSSRSSTARPVELLTRPIAVGDFDRIPVVEPSVYPKSRLEYGRRGLSFETSSSRSKPDGRRRHCGFPTQRYRLVAGKAEEVAGKKSIRSRPCDEDAYILVYI